MKNELKVEFDNTEELEKFIKQSYDETGRIKGKQYLDIPKDDILWTILNGMDNLPIKLLNNTLIEGSLRCIVDQCELNIRVTAISIYHTMDKKKYIFY